MRGNINICLLSCYMPKRIVTYLFHVLFGILNFVSEIWIPITGGACVSWSANALYDCWFARCKGRDNLAAISNLFFFLKLLVLELVLTSHFPQSMYVRWTFLKNLTEIETVRDEKITPLLRFCIETLLCVLAMGVVNDCHPFPDFSCKSLNSM